MELKKQNNNVIWALVTLVVVIAAVAVAGMLLLGHDDESIQGQMEASEYRVSSKVPGRILHFYVKEGDHVRAGDTLVVLEAPDVAAKLSQAEAAGLYQLDFLIQALFGQQLGEALVQLRRTGRSTAGTAADQDRRTEKVHYVSLLLT